jgi:hypothetical protein
LEICKARASGEIGDRDFESTDRAELIEACMLQRGWALKEKGPRCTDSLTTSTDGGCYFPDTWWGKLLSQFTPD